MSTAGFSTSDRSLGNWEEPAIHWIAVVFMISSAIPFILYVRLLRGERDILRDSQVRTFLSFLAVMVLVVTLLLVVTGRYNLADGLLVTAALALVRKSRSNDISAIVSTL